MSSTPTIECRPNGPYLVKNLENLQDASGGAISIKPTTKPGMALCRCGGSANKPFCDGTHQKIGFSGDRQVDGSTDRRDDYRGKKIIIHDNRAICAHAGRCTDGLASVFKYGSEPWIDPDGADVEAIVEAIRSCPSGALSYSIDGREHRVQGRDPAIAVTKDGPYAVVGSVQLIDQPWGAGAATETYTLCRCGGSKNKPFCDGTHWSIGFKDEGNS